jgi:hypothetical protein
MTPQSCEALLQTLARQALRLDDIHEVARNSGSPWTRAQVQLFLRCAPGVEHDAIAGTFHVPSRGGESELQDAIVEVVRSFAGRPVPASQVRARLPNHFVTTDEQILAVARRTSGLDVFGPKLIRIAQ